MGAPLEYFLLAQKTGRYSRCKLDECSQYYRIWRAAGSGVYHGYYACNLIRRTGAQPAVRYDYPRFPARSAAQRANYKSE
ncbi:hypothetical protein D3C75_765480 [compost metagenome]